MSRKLRFEVPGGYWHVTNRGVARSAIFHDDLDRVRFLALVARTAALHNWRVLAYCLMSNHFHLFIQTLARSLSLGSKAILEDYATGFNRKYDRDGHVFRGRFDAQLVENESYGLNVARYLVLNPVRKGIVAVPEDWTCSSYRMTAGLCSTPGWVDPSPIYDSLNAVDRQKAVRDYAAFVRAGIGRDVSPFDHIKKGVILGSSKFANDTLARIAAERAAAASDLIQVV